MQLNLKDKKRLLNKIRIEYFTHKNKPLSLLMFLMFFTLFALSKPVIAIFMIVAYGLILVLATRHGQQKIKSKEKENE